jgi:hypothetical protein
MNTGGTAPGEHAERVEGVGACTATHEPSGIPAPSATWRERRPKGLHQRECAEFPQRFDPGTGLLSTHPPASRSHQCLHRLVMHAGGNQASWHVCSSSAAAVVARWRQAATPQRRREAANQAPDKSASSRRRAPAGPPAQIAAMRGRAPRARTSHRRAHPPSHKHPLPAGDELKAPVARIRHRSGRSAPPGNRRGTTHSQRQSRRPGAVADRFLLGTDGDHVVSSCPEVPRHARGHGWPSLRVSA